MYEDLKEYHKRGVKVGKIGDFRNSAARENLKIIWFSSYFFVLLQYVSQ